jgi:ATP/maltotriose-dependent transcriptional regulator MalT
VRVGKGLQWSSLAATAAGVLWDFETWRDVVAVQVEVSRDAGALAALPLALNAHGMALIECGEMSAAAALIAEFETVTEATRSRVPPYATMMLAGWRGQEAEARALIDTMINDAAAGGEGLAVQFAHLTSAVLDNGLGRYERALEEARQASEMAPQLHVASWALPEEVEAAARGGTEESARDALERLTVTTQASRTDFGLGIEARSRALLSEGDAAERLYREAVERLGRTRMRPDLARAHLLYGEWLRREGRRVDSREQLRTAYDSFTAIGMEAFADRTRRELLATGEKVRKRNAHTRDDLTPQEEQIARLARDGFTNPEIGTRLFISPRTVEWHLRKVFIKLGIDSRGRLRDALRNAERANEGP